MSISKRGILLDMLLSKPRVSGNDSSKRKRFPLFGALVSGDELDKAVCAK